MNIRKLFLVIFMLVVSALFLTGCDDSQNIDSTTYDVEYTSVEQPLTPQSLVKPLELVLSESIPETNLTQYIYRDPETNILYTSFIGDNFYINSDLTPLRYSNHEFVTYSSASNIRTFKLLHKEKSGVLYPIQHYYLYDLESNVIYVASVNKYTTSLAPLYNLDGSLRTYSLDSL